MESKSLSKEEVLNHRDQVVERVECPEWGGHVFARCLTGKEFAAIDDECPGGFMVGLAAGGMCDENGKSLGYSDAEVELLSQKNAAPLKRVAKVVQRLSGMGEAEHDATAKNSESGPAESSSST
ncbi:MAG: hypothetical protein AAGJ46_12185 [Planctomycetota bacterium]